MRACYNRANIVILQLTPIAIDLFQKRNLKNDYNQWQKKFLQFLFALPYLDRFVTHNNYEPLDYIFHSYLAVTEVEVIQPPPPLVTTLAAATLPVLATHHLPVFPHETVDRSGDRHRELTRV